MIKTIFILGDFVQALGLARQVKQFKLKVFLLTKNKFSLTAFSNTVDKIVLYNNIENELGTILAKYQDKQTLLFPTSDEYIDYIEIHRIELEQMYTIALPSSRVVSLFSNKRTAYEFVTANGIPSPQSWCPNTFADVEKISKEVSYPCVIKPAVMYAFSDKFGKKAYLAENDVELLAKVKQIAKSYPIDGLLIQEFMDGGARQLYSFGTFAVDGESIVDIQVNRIRQRPMVFGKSTTYCVSCNIPEIENLAKKILAQTQYTGMGEFEFMYDKGKYKFLEINTRAWKWHTISNQRGFSFIGAWIDYLNNNMIQNMDKETPVAWVEHLFDCLVWLKEWTHHRMSLGEVLRTYCRKKEWAIWSWKDPVPGLLFPVILLRNKLLKNND